MSQIATWLSSVELDQYIPNFSNLTPQSFISITIQDYGSYGIVNLQDKQKLFRLITQLKSQPIVAPNQQSQSTYNQPQPKQVHSQPPQQRQLAPPPQHLSQPGSSLNPNVHPQAPVQTSLRGLPTISKTVIPPDNIFLDLIQQKIRVCVRKRPINHHELSLAQKDIVSIDGWNQCSVHEPKVKVDLTKYIEVSTYRYDHVFSENADNYEVYFYTAKPLIQSLFTGKSTTCFAYGQTGSGKTWTMMQRETGVYVLAAHDIFNTLNSDPVFSKLGLSAYVSFFEIYGGKLFDLLNNRNRLQALEDGKGNVHLQGLEEKQIHSVQEMLSSVDVGLSSRSVGATGANADSSRSHAILQVRLKQPNGKQHGMISFIDLAGAERASDVQNTDRQTRMEGAEINKSLLALKECIRAMDKGAHHLPFRGSKLTMVLRDSFIGDAQTVMIACISPADKSCENTNNTLRYTDRVKDANQHTKAKQGVLKPTQNVAEIVLGTKNDGDIETQQQMYQQQMAMIKNGGGANVQQYQQPQQQQMQQNPYQNIPVVVQDTPRAPSQPNDLERTHCDVVDVLYDLEDQITRAHRKQVDQMMVNVKEEVTLLHAIENNQISIDDWLLRLENILMQKEKAIQELRGQLQNFKVKLSEEQKLSESYGK
ncbi:Kinesin-like protein [Spironucleus salmonicida]|uniref:Kinesin-like protein n=1 Tax=Spironucleus salmonicida TaxID=348837 RepID=V6LJH3_9EUKA|nr:Kinesin-like protein [Spironucleus salmonicida]|eukprot:EST44740.1 Kinesin-13 [Spironucleus salmonicida]